MRRQRITITLDHNLLTRADSLIDGDTIRNRSHAIEHIIHRYFQSSIKTAVILAGGAGTKLRPYTYEVPKALLPVKGKPILEYCIENLRHEGITELIICIGYLGKKIRHYFGDGTRFGVRIVYSEERIPLHTGGALIKVRHLINNRPFLIVYGDVLTDFAIKDLIEFHEQHKSLGTVALTTTKKPTEFGQLTLHGTRLVQFYQKTKRTDIKSHLINCGIYVFGAEIFNFFPKDEKAFLLEDIIEELIEKRQLSGFVFEGKWFDVGNPDNYEQAIKEFPQAVQK